MNVFNHEFFPNNGNSNFTMERKMLCFQLENLFFSWKRISVKSFQTKFTASEYLAFLNNLYVTAMMCIRSYTVTDTSTHAPNHAALGYCDNGSSK